MALQINPIHSSQPISFTNHRFQTPTALRPQSAPLCPCQPIQFQRKSPSSKKRSHRHSPLALRLHFRARSSSSQLGRAWRRRDGHRPFVVVAFVAASIQHPTNPRPVCSTANTNLSLNPFYICVATRTVRAITFDSPVRAWTSLQKCVSRVCSLPVHTHTSTLRARHAIARLSPRCSV